MFSLFPRIEIGVVRGKKEYLSTPISKMIKELLFSERDHSDAFRISQPC